MSKDADRMFSAWASGSEWLIVGEGYRAQVAASMAAVEEAHRMFGDGSKELTAAIAYGNAVLDKANEFLASAPDVIAELVIADTDWDDLPE